MEWGEFDIRLVSDGAIWLDGGAMYGVVPRTLWSRVTAPDAENRIEVALNCLLVRTPSGNVLLDTGIGTKYDAKFADLYRVDRSRTLLSELERQGVTAEDIKVVINSHLHFDHAGGNTRRTADGRLVPTFPNAGYVVQRDEWLYASAPSERSRASYHEEDWGPLAAAGLLHLVEGDQEILPGVSVFVTPGHLRAHQSVRVESARGTLVFLADVIPTPHHLKLPWIMSYDLYPLDTLATKRQIIDRALAEHWLLAFYHDAQTPLAYIKDVNGRIAVEPIKG